MSQDTKSAAPMFGKQEPQTEGNLALDATLVDVEASDASPLSGISPAALREKILFATKKKREIREVFVPQWGFHVYMRGMSAAEHDEWEAAQVKIGKKGKVEYNQSNMRASLVAKCLCDPTGAPVMKTEDVARLGAGNAAPIIFLYGIGKEMSGTAQKDVDDAEDDLGNAPSGSGSSD